MTNPPGQPDDHPVGANVTFIIRKPLKFDLTNHNPNPQTTPHQDSAQEKARKCLEAAKRRM